jgi:hypothetical protein
LQAAPALVGAFVGAPVLARELETGTFWFAWTLGFGRWRWTLGKLVPLAIAVAAAAGLSSLDELPARQPVLAVPVDRGRLAGRAVGAAHPRRRLAGPPPRRLRRNITRTAVVHGA